MKRILVVSLLLSLVVVSGFYLSPAKAVAQIDILSNSGWTEPVIGYYHVSGEVQNVGDGAASSVMITATFYNSSNALIANSIAFTDLNIVLPGRKSPFEITLLNTAQAAMVDHYALSVTFSSANSIPLGLQILSSNSSIDGFGYMHVTGEIKNVEAGMATQVKVIATFYDSTGTVVASAFKFLEPITDINPGQIAQFDVTLQYTNRVPFVNSYALTAQSNQYAMVPEFPSIVVLPLLMVLATLAVAILTKTRTIHD